MNRPTYIPPVQRLNVPSNPRSDCFPVPCDPQFNKNVAGGLVNVVTDPEVDPIFSAWLNTHPYVPYSGATANLDMGAFSILAGLGSIIGDRIGGNYWTISELDLGVYGKIPLLTPTASFPLGNYGAIGKAVIAVDPIQASILVAKDDISEYASINMTFGTGVLNFGLNGTDLMSMSGSAFYRTGSPEEMDMGKSTDPWKCGYFGEICQIYSGAITRDGNGYISEIARTGGKTYTITRDADNRISSFTDSALTWTLTRNANNFIESWAVA